MSFAGIINVQDYGAKGDGTTDDGPAINAAIAAARKTGQYGTGLQGAPVYFPPGVYMVNEGLNCTVGQFNLVGAGPYQSVIRGNTGQYAIIDLTSSDYSTVNNLMLDTVGMANPSAIGILVARNATPGSQATGVNLHNVVVRLDTNPSANGGNGTVGVYNFASEESVYQDALLRGDTGLYAGGGNLFKVTSAYQDILQGDQSMTQLRVSGASSLIGIAGPALRLDAGGDMEIHAYLTSHFNQFPGVDVAPYAIESTAIWTGLAFTGSVEAFPGFLRQSGDVLRGLRASPYMAAATGQGIVMLDGVELADSDLAWIATADAIHFGLTPWMVAGTGANSSVTSSRFQCGSAKGIQGTGTAAGNLLMARSPAASVQVDFPNASGNLIIGTDGILPAPA